jgi:uncharacterized protein DUF3306
MSEQEKFLERWSRRKQKAAELAKETAAGEPNPAQAENPAVEEKTAISSAPSEPAKQTTEGFDVSSLPPIDSIAATTDIRPFLAPGVPPELTRAALQKAWRNDPAIRDFIGLSENSWDFNDPNSMHGFGPLHLTDEMKQMVTQMLGSFRASDSDRVEKAQKPEETGGPKSASAVQNSGKEGGGTARIVDAKSGDEKNILSPKHLSATQKTSLDHVATQREIGSQAKNDLKAKGRHGSALPRK